MNNFEGIIAHDFLQKNGSKETILIETNETESAKESKQDKVPMMKKVRMKVRIKSINADSCIIKFKENSTHSPIITEDEVKTNGYNRKPTKICDYLVMLRDKNIYLPILIEMTKIKRNLNLNKKFEQLYCTWPLFEYAMKVYSYTCSGKIRIAPPIFALLYEIESLNEFAPPSPVNLIDFHFNENLIVPIRGHGTPEAAYRYKKSPLDIVVVSKMVSPKSKLDLHDIVKSRYHTRYE